MEQNDPRNGMGDDLDIVPDELIEEKSDEAYDRRDRKRYRGGRTRL